MTDDDTTRAGGVWGQVIGTRRGVCVVGSDTKHPGTPGSLNLTGTLKGNWIWPQSEAKGSSFGDSGKKHQEGSR